MPRTSIVSYFTDFEYTPTIKAPKRKKRKSVVSYNISRISEPNETFQIGSFLLGTSNQAMPETYTTCTCNINETNNADFLVVNFSEDFVVSIKLLVDAPLVKDIITTNIFHIKLTQSQDNIHIWVYLKNLPLNKTSVRIAKTLKTIFTITSHMPADPDENFETSSVLENVNAMYKTIRSIQNAAVIPKCDVQSKHLRPLLRPYQRDAVQWMLHREKTFSLENTAHPSYTEINLPSGETIYFDKFSGCIQVEPPMVGPLPTGGILADEMGLGKTVELLACILYDYAGKTNEKLTIGKHNRKRTFQETETEQSTPKIVENVLDVPEGWAKKKRKSDMKQVLEDYYNATLVSVNDRVKKKEVEAVVCICGDKVKRNVVKCDDCGVLQHADCMGYKKHFGDYICPECWKQKPLLETKGTLIVCPNTLCKQWLAEIKKHVASGLKVFAYKGTDAAQMYPMTLLKYDVVVTTYSVLQADFKFVNVVPRKKLRNQAKYANSGCPIALIKWHRLCFDEAQSVERFIISEMAQKLVATHRWAVTGTPISKGVADLYSLIDYLKVDPYWNQNTFNNILYKPYQNGYPEEMNNFLSKILWRTQKCDVEDQIYLPVQTTIMHQTEFTAVERYFYERECEMSRNEFYKCLPKYNLQTPLINLQRADLKKILAPFLSIRKACAHHTAAKSRYLATQKEMKSMGDLLDALIAKNLNDCEDLFRIIISASNGVAGVLLLQANIPAAIEQYTKILKITGDYSDAAAPVMLVADTCQLIHTMHNLAEILDESDSERRDALRQKCLEMQMKFINRVAAQTILVVQSTAKSSQEISKLQDKLALPKAGQWYAGIAEHLTNINSENELLSRVGVILNNNNYHNINIRNSMQVLHMIQQWEATVEELREVAVNAINVLYTISENTVVIKPSLVINAANCHLRPIDKKKGKKNFCGVCVANKKLKEYESALFFSTSGTVGENKTGNWKPAVEEHILKAMYSIGKNKLPEDNELLADGKHATKIPEGYRKEFKDLRKLWTYLDQQICANDEVDICKIRLQLKEATEKEEERPNFALRNLAYEIRNSLATINQMEEHEIEYQLSALQSEVAGTWSLLDKQIGKQKYLKTLYSQQASGKQPDPCPICRGSLEKQYNVLKCGHCYCMDCMQALLGRSTGRCITCSVCRENLRISDICYIDNSAKTPIDGAVKGNGSSKMIKVVKIMLDLLEKDENVKVLIFSNWPIVLKVLKDVLDANTISCVLFESGPDRALAKFKDQSLQTTALLIPIKSGSKGLNIIEATHVIFVEPVLDPADELQAIGRVHRIGQIQPTFVHKILVQDSIEENLHCATNNNAEEWALNKVTIEHIQKLFVESIGAPLDDLDG